MTDPDNTPAPRPRRRWLTGIVVAVIVFAVGAALILINTTATTEVTGRQPNDRATTAATASIETQGSPESVVATFRNGRVNSVRAVGDSSLGADSQFYIGSLSKSFAAMTTARLLDRGLLHLDTPVRHYLPWFRTQSGASGSITVRHLLNQTSGLPTSAGMIDIAEPNTTLLQRVRALRTVDLQSEPGREFHYSNKNFATLALVVEQVTGRPYAEVLRREVVVPLGLRRTVIDPRAASGRDVSKGNLVLFGAHLPASMPPYPGAVADGYVISTPRDLARFGDVLATGRYRGRPYVSPRLFAATQRAPRAVAPDPDYGSTYGMGVRLKDFAGRRAVWHEGELSATHADLGVLPDTRAGMIVLSTHNSQLFSADQPFIAGMTQLAGGRATEAADGGYRASALTASALMALLLGAITVDLGRWTRLGRISRGRRALRSTLPRVLLAVALWVGTFYGLGAAFGLPGALPLALSWQGATDVTAVVLALIGYLVVSALALLAWTPWPVTRPREDRAPARHTSSPTA